MKNESKISHARNGVDIAKLHRVQSLMDKTLDDAARKAGVTREDFAKLPKREQNEFLRQAKTREAREKEPERIQMIAHGRLEPSPTNREEFDPEQLTELRESVRMRGVRQPLIVRPHPNADKRVMGFYEIVAGERRWIVSGDVGLAELPCIVRELDDEEALEEQTIENLQRENLNALDEARMFKQITEAYQRRGMTKEEAVARLMERVSCKRAAVFKKIALLELSEKGKAEVRAGRLLPSAASEALRVKAPERRESLVAEMLPAPGAAPLTYDEAKQIADRAVEKEKRQQVWRAKAAVFDSKGWRVLTPEECRHLFVHESILGMRSGYVKAEDVKHGYWVNEKEQTWKTLMGKRAPAPVLAQNNEGSPVEIYDAAEAEAAAKKNGHDFYKAAKEKTEAKKNEAKAKEKLRDAHAMREAVYETALKTLVASAEGGRDLNLFYSTVAANLVGRLGPCDLSDLVARRRKLEEPRHDNAATLRQWALKGFTQKENRGLIMEMLLGTYAPQQNRPEPWNEGFRKLCKAWGVDLAKLEKQVQARGL